MRARAGLVLFVLTVAAALLLSSCAGFGRRLVEPRIALDAVRLDEFHLDSADLLFVFDVENPNDVALVLDAVGYRLRVAGEPLLRGRTTERLSIPARGDSRVELPVRIRYSDFARVVERLGRRERPEYELDADFLFDAPYIGGIQVPLRRTGELPLARWFDRLGRSR